MGIEISSDKDMPPRRKAGRIKVVLSEVVRRRSHRWRVDVGQREFPEGVWQADPHHDAIRG
jgi:hypothetical protein